MPDVVEALKRDFHNKCYICELDHLQDQEIEHRIPHHGDKELEFRWDNLFWACGHCNSVKNQKKYDSGIVDCCTRDPEQLIYHRCAEGKVGVEAISDNSDSEVQNTVLLLNEVFNKDNTGMRVARTQERYRLLLQEMNVLYKTLESYEREEDKEPAQAMLKALLDRRSAFSAFKRNYVREHREWYPELIDLLDAL